MRVLCVKIVSPVIREEVLEHPGVRIDAEYQVLSILAQPRRGAQFRIITDDGIPALYDAAMFVTTDDTLPPNWVVRTSDAGVVEIAPRVWLQPGFWERYFDGDPIAREEFATERDGGLFP
jgi:hypothetical protein